MVGFARRDEKGSRRFRSVYGVCVSKKGEIDGRALEQAAVHAGLLVAQRRDEVLTPPKLAPRPVSGANCAQKVLLHAAELGFDGLALLVELQLGEETNQIARDFAVHDDRLDQPLNHGKERREITSLNLMRLKRVWAPGGEGAAQLIKWTICDFF